VFLKDLKRRDFSAREAAETAEAFFGLRRLGYVSGAIRNRISPERSFLKTYIQLSEARPDAMLWS